MSNLIKQIFKGKIFTLGIVALVFMGVAGFFAFADWKTKKMLEEHKQITGNPLGDPKLEPFYALRDFAEKIDDCQNFGKQALQLNFKPIDINATYENFGIGTWVGNGFVPSVEGVVAVFQDDDVWARQINEYKVNLKTNDVVSMRQIDDPKRTPVDEMTSEEVRENNGQQRALYTFLLLPSNPNMSEIIRTVVEENTRNCLSRILGAEMLSKIDKSSTSLYKFTHLIGKENIENSDRDPRYVGQKHVLRWENESYRPPKGLGSLMFPFVQVVITNSGHILSYESNLSFFEDIQ